jgi:hypothetical protein
MFFCALLAFDVVRRPLLVAFPLVPALDEVFEFVLFFAGVFECCVAAERFFPLE